MAPCLRSAKRNRCGDGIEKENLVPVEVSESCATAQGSRVLSVEPAEKNPVPAGARRATRKYGSKAEVDCVPDNAVGGAHDISGSNDTEGPVDHEADTSTRNASSSSKRMDNIIDPVLSEIQKTMMIEPQEDNAIEILAALDKLNQHLTQNPRMEMEALKLGALSWILCCLRRLSECPVLFAQGFRCLYRVACQDNRDAQKLFVSLGGLEVVLDAMRSFPEDDLVQVYGIMLLDFSAWEIYEDFDDRLRLHWSRIVKDLGGVALALESMKRFPDSNLIQCNGCHMLSELANIAEFKDMIRKSGAVATVGAALERYPDDIRIHKDATACMEALRE